MTLNTIGPNYAGGVADTHFDPLGKKAAELLADLLPLAHVNLRYKTDPSQENPRTLKGILHTSVMRVPGEDHLWREITIKRTFRTIFSCCLIIFLPHIDHYQGPVKHSGFTSKAFR